MDIFLPKGGPFLTTYPPHSVHIVFERPLVVNSAWNTSRNNYATVYIEGAIWEFWSFKETFVKLKFPDKVNRFSVLEGQSLKIMVTALTL